MNGETKNTSCVTPRKLKFEQVRADYELFLQTFERPTWIYRLLHRRHQLSPFLLHRNLSYIQKNRRHLKKDSGSTRKSRKGFDTASLLDRAVAENKRKNKQQQKDEEGLEAEKIHHMNLTFGGFFHGPGFAEEIFHTNDVKAQEIYKDDFVHVKVDLLQLHFKRKKDVEPITVVNLGNCKAPWNPRTQFLTPGTSVQITVPPDVFNENNKAYKTQILSISVSLNVPKKKKKKPGRKKKEAATEEPPAKRLRGSVTSESQVEEDTNTTTINGFEHADEKPVFDSNEAAYSAELIVFDRYKTCLLSDGDYELLLHNEAENNESRKNNTFESKFKNKLGPFAAFSFGPTIKFNLNWTTSAPINILPAYKTLNQRYLEEHQAHESQDEAVEPKSMTAANKTTKPKESSLPKVYYQFLYCHSTRQQTEAREGTSCPWCDLQCWTIYGLLRHLKSFHNRFSFVYTALKRSHRIDVSVNETFENSLGFDGVRDIGFIDIDNAPIKRKPTSEILVGRRHVDVEDLKEFTEADKSDMNGAFSIVHHKRSYFHSNNNQQIPDLGEFGYNSEDEGPPDWLKEKTGDMIEDFTDVNRGEKVLMKLWNLHVLESSYVADFMVALGCETFVQKYGHVILNEGLTRNFLIHLNNLLEFQVISQSHIVSAIKKLSQMKKNMKSVTNEE